MATNGMISFSRCNTHYYLHDLLERDRIQLACLRGIQDIELGNYRPFEEFDKDFRKVR